MPKSRTIHDKYEKLRLEIREAVTQGAPTEELKRLANKMKRYEKRNDFLSVLHDGSYIEWIFLKLVLDEIIIESGGAVE